MFYDFLWWDPDPENLTGSGRIRILFNDNVIFQYFVTAESRFPTLAELVHHHSIHSDGLITQVIVLAQNPLRSPLLNSENWSLPKFP